MDFTSDQLIKVVIALIGLIGVIFAVNKRSHKVGDINGSNNKVNNGDVNKKSHNKK